MKLSLLSTLACTAAASPFAYPAQPSTSTDAAPADEPKMVCFGPGGRVADPPGAAPKKVELKSDSTTPGTKRVKLR